MAGAGLMNCNVDEVHAATLTQSNPFNDFAQNGNGSMSIYFNGFNAALGTLTEVDVSLSSPSVTGADNFSYTGAEGGGSSFNETAAVIEPTTTVLTSAAGTASSFCYAGGSSCTKSGPFALSAALSTAVASLTDTASLQAFTGVGPTVDLTAALENYSRSSSCQNGSCNETDTVDFTGTPTVVYDYVPTIPTSVPEPAPLALLSFGVFCVAGMRRRQGMAERPS